MRFGAKTVARFLIGVVALVAVAELSARAAEASGPPALRWYDASAQLKVEEMEEMGPVDVVFAGTSMAWQGLDPTVFAREDGRSAFNAGLAGGVPEVMEPWLLDQVVPRMQPQTVIWGLSSLDFSASYGSDNLERYEDALETRSGGLAEAERAASALSALVRYRGVLRDPSALFGSERDRIEADFGSAEEILGPGGVRRDFEVAVTEQRRETVGARVRNFALDPADVAAMHRTVSALQQAGVEVVLAEMPVPQRYVDLHPDGAEDMRSVHEAIRAIAERLELDLIDLRFGFTDDDFVDFTHLNEESAERLTATLADSFVTTTTPVDPEFDAATLLPTAQLALAVNDDVFWRLNATQDVGPTEMWYSYHHFAKQRGLAVAQQAGESKQVIALGSSLVNNAFIPELFTEEDGRSAFNGGLPGVKTLEVALWLRDMVALADPELVVLGIAPRELRPNFRDREECTAPAVRWERQAELRAQVFERVSALAEFTTDQLFFGDPLTVEPIKQTRISRVAEQFLTPSGGRRGFEADTPAAMRAQRDQLQADYTWFFPCQELLDAFTESITWLKERDIKVVVVAMPVSDFNATVFVNGRDEIDEILDLIAEQSLAAGADGYIDLSAAIPDDDFRDLAHVGEQGAKDFTRLLAEELAARGL